jgi:predicted transcriptional regulator
MAKRKKEETMHVQAFRFSESLVRRLDKHAERLARERPGLRVTRADALRMLLVEGLDREEARRGKA